jgi:hypothetical protein
MRSGEKDCQSSRTKESNKTLMKIRKKGKALQNKLSKIESNQAIRKRPAGR